jgi:prepilin peptidase CpaA
LGAVLFRYGILGGGDVKLYAATALWVGWEHLPIHSVYIGALGLCLALVLIIARQFIMPAVFYFRPTAGAGLPKALIPGEGVPYGVAIALSTTIVILF